MFSYANDMMKSLKSKSLTRTCKKKSYYMNFKHNNMSCLYVFITFIISLKFM